MINNLFRYCFFIFIFFTTLSVDVLAYSGSGSGINGDPYLITSCNQFIEIQNDRTATYFLSQDIDCSENANDMRIVGVFSGEFKGGGHTITLSINESTDNIGLFASLSGASISRVRIAGSILGTGNNVGAIAGSMSNGSVISKVTNTAYVRGSNYVGGLVGSMSSGYIYDSYNSGNMSTSGGSMVGGLVGILSGDATIVRGYNSGQVGNSDETRYHLGGLIGFRSGTNSGIEESFNVGQVLTAQSTFFFGGIFGNDTSSGGGVLSSGFIHTYFDVSQSTRSMCGYGNDGSNLGTVAEQCEGVNISGNDASYFKNNTTNGPLGEWDFTSTWRTNVNGYPTLRAIIEPQPEIAPVISETTPVSTLGNNTTPQYVFSSDKVGTINYGGSCSSATINAVEGLNTITFNTLADGVYSNCTITVTDSGSRISNQINISSFAIDTVPPVLNEITPISPSTSIENAVYHFSTSKICSILASPPTTSTGDVELLIGSTSVINAGITAYLAGLQSGGTYSFRFQCRDSAGNISNRLEVGPYTVVSPVVVQKKTTIPLAILQKMSDDLRGISQQAIVSNSKTDADKFLCSKEQVLTQNLKTGARNGKYNSFTKGIVTEAKILQLHLNRLGFNSGPVDGVLGPISDGAIKKLQQSLGTKQDGLVGVYTRLLLNNSCNK